MREKIKNKAIELKNQSENFDAQINKNRIVSVHWSDNGWMGVEKKKDFFVDADLFKYYRSLDGYLHGAEIEVRRNIFFISLNPDDKRYYIIGYFYISEIEDATSGSKKRFKDYYIKGDPLKSKMIYNYSNPKKNILFDKKFIENNTKLDLNWNSRILKNYSDYGKIGLWFKNSGKGISNDDANKILKIINNFKEVAIDFVHPTRDLIEKALDELGKTKASKNELIPKLKEIVGRDGGILVDDENAWNEIQKLSDEKYK